MDSGNKKHKPRYDRIMPRVYSKSRLNLKSNISVTRHDTGSARVGGKPCISNVSSGAFSELPLVLNDYIPEEKPPKRTFVVKPRKTIKSLEPVKPPVFKAKLSDVRLKSRNIRVSGSVPTVLEDGAVNWSDSHVRQCYSSRSHSKLQELKSEIRAYKEKEDLVRLRSQLYNRCGLLLDEFGQVAEDKAVQAEGLDSPPADISQSTSSTWDDPAKPSTSAQNYSNEQMTPIKLEIIRDGSDATSKLDAYDKFALSISNKIKSIHAIAGRIRLMNAVQDLVDNFCAKNAHDEIDSSSHETMYVPMVGGVIAQGMVLQPKESHGTPAADTSVSQQATQPAAPAVTTQAVHVQQITIEPSPSALPHEKKTKKTPAKRRKVTEPLADRPMDEHYAEVPVDTTLPTEFVSLDPKTDAPTISNSGETKPQVDILEIKEEKIQDKESASPATAAPIINESAMDTISGITFINDPIPVKFEVLEDLAEF